MVMLPPGGYSRDHAEAQSDRRKVPSVVKGASLGNLEGCFNWTCLEMPLGQLVDSSEGPSTPAMGDLVEHRESGLESGILSY